MPLKHKIFALAALPLLLSVFIVGVQVFRQQRRLAEQQAILIEESLLAAKRNELRHYVELALSTIEPIYGSGADDTESQQRAKTILRETRYGRDGYFFVYDLQGNCLVHPYKPELVGRDLRGLTDLRGRQMIPAMIETGTHGDGYQRYMWEKPSTRQPTEKLGYVAVLPRWGWIIGTGIYLDDVERATREVRNRSTNSVRKTMWELAVVA